MVMTCVDRFSRMVQLVSLQESDIHTIDDKFLSMVASQHGLPKCITSSCDPQFCRHFWEELMSLLDMILTFSMALHSQTNRIVEIMNCTME